MKLLYTAFLLFLTVSLSTISAQPSLGSWQWAKKAGGINNTSLPNREHEVVKDICTDKYGNVYTVGSVYEFPYFEGTHYTLPFGSFGDRDAYVAKYDKCGNLKWVRFGGGSAYDEGTAIHVDDSLNVYIIGYTGSYNITFPDSNHTLTAIHPGFFWAKYDLAGNVKWLNVSNVGSGPPLNGAKLIAKPNENISTVVSIDTGSFFTGFNFSATHIGNAIFEFNLNGAPVSMLPIDSFGWNTAYSNLNFADLAYDSKGNMIFTYACFDTIRFFDTLLRSPSGSTRAFLIKVDGSTHKVKWIKEWQQDFYRVSGFGNIKIDDNDNIYATATAGRNSAFNGDTVKYISPSNGTIVFYKLDSNANTLWRDIYNTTANYSPPTLPFVKYDKDHYLLPVPFGSTTYFGGDTIIAPANRAPYYITLVNATTGKVEYYDSLALSTNNNSTISTTTSDEQGNVYLGGYFSAKLSAGNTIQYMGGIDDAFVLKWGVNCTDSISLIAPLSAEGLTANASGQAIDVDWHSIAQYTDRYRVYRSLTDSLTGYSLIDSVSKTTNHYTDVNVVPNQVYWYKVSAVNNAGESFSNSDSANTRTVGIIEANNIRHISLYPNPATNYTELSIWSDASLPLPAVVSVTDMEGREVYMKQAEIQQGKNDLMIDISSVGTGVYVVNIRSDNESHSKRLVIVR